MMPAMGAMKVTYSPMNDRNESAEASTLQGAIAQQPRSEVRNALP